ncbi:MAG TPA: glycosyltransferase family 2 protein [Anaerolineaceae bacterium]|nr:glycosyltransferase family 2 protein [Anaerolineaceae bacterium]HQC64490.1 glycosyltransferase family 2 protein [Anaerolineaceae bacterium]
MATPFLSIIIPAHNEAARLPQTLASVQNYLTSKNFNAEVIVVENASTDETTQIVRDWQAKMPNLRLISREEAGKGGAIKQGMLEARGAYRFMADADLSMPISELDKFLSMGKSHHVAIASREAKGAKRVGEPEYRHLIGRAFNLLVKLIVLPKVEDSQCGFKWFSAEAAQRIFPLQTMTGWSFDVEVLAIARELGYTVTEVPITWYYREGSRINVFKDSWHMFRDLWHIRRKRKQGMYRG